MKPYYKIVNSGTTAIEWSKIEVRYYMVKDGTSAAFRSGNLVYPDNLQNNLTIAFVQVSGNNYYAKMTFAGTTATIGAGVTTGECKQSIFQDNATSPSQSNDNSFDATKTSYALSTKIVVYYNGSVVYGTAPY
jgi:hypothetical protein